MGYTECEEEFGYNCDMDYAYDSIVDEAVIIKSQKEADAFLKRHPDMVRFVPKRFVDNKRVVFTTKA